MGEHEAKGASNERQLRAFSQALMADVHALEQMLERGLIETGVRRIGAEQEMFLVDRYMRPACAALAVLDKAHDPRLTTELAMFNLEGNASPLLFGGSCLRELEAELLDIVEHARVAARACQADVLLTGILPTLRKSDLGLESMTPNPRYLALNEAMTKLRGGDFHVLIKGVDELETTHDNVMLESCNTSFQVHFQVAPEEFARLYNMAQAMSAPVLAAAVNSPLLLGHRLWKETRLALFQRSVDARSSAHQARGLRPRVSFGDSWVKESVLEIFREDIARFRVVLSSEAQEDPLQAVAEGRIPQLAALRLHNGTVYRWNRACYGIGDSGPHLRIENRVLPAGPSVLDEVANAAFFFGLMAGGMQAWPDIAAAMDFDDAKGNLIAAARLGLQAQFSWIGGKSLAAGELILEELLPLARQGLTQAGIDSADIERYLGVIAERVQSEQTGARWMLDSLAAMGPGNREIKERSLLHQMLARQRENHPVHTWPLCPPPKDEDFRQGFRTVGQLMSTDVFTVRPQDAIDLVANVMDWEHIRHVPVEDDEGRLVGIVTHRAFLRMVARRRELGHELGNEPVAVADVMKRDPITVTPDMPTLEAIRLMREHRVGCMPVVENGRLVGVITERDLIEVSARLLENFLREE